MTDSISSLALHHAQPSERSISPFRRPVGFLLVLPERSVVRLASKEKLRRFLETDLKSVWKQQQEKLASNTRLSLLWENLHKAVGRQQAQGWAATSVQEQTMQQETEEEDPRREDNRQGQSTSFSLRTWPDHGIHSGE